jgi:fibronectin-binding autotransporter adhesin
LIKTGSGTLVLSGISTFTGGVSINGGTVTVSDIANAGVASSLGAGNSLTLDGGTLSFNIAGTDATDRSIVLNANGGTFNSATFSTVTLSGVISGTGGFTKTGTGPLRLTATNTFSGPITINAAYIEVPTVTDIGVPGPLGAGSNIVINGGAIIIPGFNNHSTNRTISLGPLGGTFSPGNGTLTLSGPISGIGGFFTTGNGMFVLSATNTFAGDVFVSSCIIRVVNGQAIPDTADVFLGGFANPPKILDLNNSSEAIGSLSGGDDTGGFVTLGSGTLTIGGNNLDKSYDGVISGTGGVVKVGTGTQTLSRASTFTGSFTIQNGAISTAAVAGSGINSPLGAGNSLVLGALASVGSISYTGTVDGATNRIITVDGLGGGFEVTEASTTLNLDGIIGGSGGLTKSGPGSLFISGTPTYSGPTLVNSGTLTLNGGLDTPGGGVTVAAGATLQARNTVNRSISGAGTITATANLNIGNTSSTSGFAFGGTLNVGSNNVLLSDADPAQLGVSTTLGPGGRLTSVNGITLGNGKSVTASATASGSISGTFVNNGTVTGPTTAGQMLTFNNNVSGTGFFEGNLRFAGNFAPGINGPFLVTLENFTMVDATNLLLEIGGLTIGAQFDRLNFIGTGQLDGTLSITLIGGFQPVEGNSFTVLQGGTLTGTFDTLNLPGLAPGLAWQYVQTANSTTLVVIPEPSAALAVLMGVAMFSGRRRRYLSSGKEGRRRVAPNRM